MSIIAKLPDFSINTKVISYSSVNNSEVVSVYSYLEIKYLLLIIKIQSGSAKGKCPLTYGRIMNTVVNIINSVVPGRDYPIIN